MIFSVPDLFAVSTTPKAPAGSIWENPNNKSVWAYVQAAEALKFGDRLAVNSFAAINDVPTAAVAADTRRITATGVFTTTALIGIGDNAEPNGHVYHLFTDATAGQNQGGPIKRIDDDTIDVYVETSDDGLFDVALTTSSGLIIFTNTRVKIEAADGIAGGYVQHQAGIADESWFWCKVKGKGWGRIDTSDTALTAGEPVARGTVAGTVQGAASGVGEEDILAGDIAIGDIDADGPVPLLINRPISVFARMTEMPSNLSSVYPDNLDIGQL